MIHASLEITRPFWASAEKIFDAFLDPDLARQFLFATAEGEMVEAQVNPCVGGKFNLIEIRDGEKWEHWGEFLAITRPSLLAFTLHVPWMGPGETRVDIAIQPILDGCELTLVHTFDALYLEQKNQLEHSWHQMLDQLAQVKGITGLYE